MRDGAIPWRNVPLHEVATLERSIVQASDIVSGTIYVGLENIKSDGSFIDVQTVEAGDLASSKFHFSSQHLLYGRLRPYLAKVACPTFDGICSTDIVPLLPKQNVSRRFLFHVLRQPSMIDYASSRAVGINLPRLPSSVLADLPIPLPPLADQQRIAVMLDTADSLRAQRQAILGQLNSLADSVFLEFFGDPVVNPKNWPENMTLGQMADITSGITKGRTLNGRPTRPVPYLAVANVQDKALSMTGLKTIEATEDEITRLRLVRNDLLLTEGGDPDKLGRGTLWNSEVSEAIHQNHIFRVRIRVPDIEPLFLNWLIGSQRGKRYFLKSAKQTTGIASINMTQLRNFPMLVPPIQLQRKFVAVMRMLDTQRSALWESASKLDGLFASLQQRAFRGEL